MLRRTLITVLVVIAVVLTVVFWPKANTAKQTAAQAQAAAKVASAPAPLLPVKASVYVVKPSVLNNQVLTTGTILANEEVVLTSEASGKVTGLSFTEGGTVRKGDLLAQLNDGELRAQLDRANSRLKLANAQEYRQRVLLQRQAISQQEYDVISGELSNAASEVALTKAQLLKTQIRAPFSGTIGLRRVSAGSYVSPGTPLATLQNLEQVKLEFSIPEKYASTVKVGQTISFRVRSSPDTFSATVFAIEPKIDASTRSLQLRASAKNTARTLVPGSFADIDLVLDRQESAILVPSEAVIPDLAGHRVFRITDGKATNERIQITEGLAIGDSIVVGGVLITRPGSPIIVTSVVD
jgi:membrane fusion protein, multidrug efflux system